MPSRGIASLTISRQREGTYDQNTFLLMGWLPFLLVGISALVLLGVIALWTGEVFGWWRWRMREYDWWGRKKRR
jgi:hypothetical protein